MKFYLYKVINETSTEFCRCFKSLKSAKCFAYKQNITDVCFILSDDLSKLYFVDECEWDYELLDDTTLLNVVSMICNIS